MPFEIKIELNTCLDLTPFLYFDNILPFILSDKQVVSTNIKPTIHSTDTHGANQVNSATLSMLATNSRRSIGIFGTKLIPYWF